jgi:hypothetical protein
MKAFTVFTIILTVMLLILIAMMLRDLFDGGLNDVCEIWATTDDGQRICVEWKS